MKEKGPGGVEGKIPRTTEGEKRIGKFKKKG